MGSAATQTDRQETEMRRCLVAAAVGVAMAMAGGAVAAEVEGKMLN